MLNKIIPFVHAEDAPLPGDIGLTMSKASGFDTLSNATIPKMITVALNLALIAVSLIFFFVLIFGGLKWITSEGDEKKLTAARNQVTNALVGLVIVFAAWAIVALLGSIFNVNILKLTIPTLRGV
jgi:TRAP-type C4-dicarboxylate transport system permease small subunit